MYVSIYYNIIMTTHVCRVRPCRDTPILELFLKILSTGSLQHSTMRLIITRAGAWVGGGVISKTVVYPEKHEFSTFPCADHYTSAIRLYRYSRYVSIIRRRIPNIPTLLVYYSQTVQCENLTGFMCVSWKIICLINKFKKE